MKEEIGVFCPINKQEWRSWLEENHLKKEGVWLILHKKNSLTPNLTWSEAVDEALCFGWIDSVKKAIDSQRYKQYFGKRKVKSTWSKINKEKIEELKSLGLVVEAGLKSVELAKENGSWTILDSVENYEIPNDLEQEFKQRESTRTYFLSLSKSIQKALLQWIVLAKRSETRKKRIKEIVENAHNKKIPKQFR